MVLIKDKGALIGLPIDAYRDYARVQRRGPDRRRLRRAAVQAMIAAGNRINHFPDSYGGAHGDRAQTMSQSNPNPAAVPGAEENGGPE